ncbi:glucans biosynthesis glucosyltransferase MdoH [Aminobacterium sp. UBA5514]|uniref:glucans biosynthesis glucosyltransferase MdoH n=1 Tax=Aminobacterium sp. UBA5514 TaxID=1946036 RepID=UPI00257ECF69|nr:glucans biosynthesis glucosyltransferase MdoH [Aminobacterium sp. UBA5514]
MNVQENREIKWTRSASWRRIILLSLIIVPTITASRYMAGVLPYKGETPLEIGLVVVFAILFAWISIGFWTAMLGFLVLLKQKKSFSLTSDIKNTPLDIKDPEAKTAILVPIYNEDVHRVMAGVRATLQTLRNTGQDQNFHIFILSDTTDPDVWVHEETAWYELCREEEAFGSVFYRHRKSNVKRKSGNVADFCRRWGKSYRYMIVFDADSIMSGVTMVRMVQIMEQRPDIGILQTPPAAVNRQSLISRVQQFANRAYGPIFAAGLHFWVLGDAQYWGHNAIIRVEPFMEHCQLPRLPGKGPLSGDILSHDFVEAALMRRAGYGVWLAYDMEGSYEETPPTLLDELKRDRRWCQGNLQHLRLIFTRGLFPVHRALFINGVMSYGSAFLWLLFLVLSSIEAITEVIIEPQYFPSAELALFPEWPVWYPHWAITLLGSTVLILFLPKVLTILYITFVEKKAHQFGGFIRLCFSVLIEIVLSTLLAPIRMIFHSRFVVMTLAGRATGWGTQTRDDRGTTWGDAFQYHIGQTLLAALWGTLLYEFNPSFFWWMSPILGALFFSVPISALTSRVSIGKALKRNGILLTPEEKNLPLELKILDEKMEAPLSYTPFPLPREQGFVRAVVDPTVLALHTSLILRHRIASPSIRRRREDIQEKALLYGPESLTQKEKMELLRDPEQLKELHQRVWRIPEWERAAQWGLE